MQKNVIMSVDHLSKDFVIRGKKLGEKSKLLHALSDVSFDIYEGETLGIIGESGCGKSTLGRCLVKLHKPSAGTITYNGKDLWNLPVYEREAARRDIQMIFQDSGAALNPRMSIRQIMLEPVKISRRIRDREMLENRLREILKETGLDESILSKKPGELSGGQRQRVAIGRSLLMEPRLIIADEPIASLDISIQAQIVMLFKKLQQEKRFSFLFIAHDLSMVRFLSDTTGVMKNGKLVEMAPTKELFENPQHPYTQSLLSAIHIPDPLEERKRRLIEYEELQSLGEGWKELSACHCVRI